MNWEAIGAIGEVVGALAVVVTLIFLAMQVRHSNRSMDESNRLERASAIDRHTDSISRWRGRLMENEELIQIWLIALSDGELSESERFRLDNLWIDFVNTQRSNFVRAKVVGEEGMARQAAFSVAVEIKHSNTLKEQWDMSRPWHELASTDFVEAVGSALANLTPEELTRYRPGTRQAHQALE